MKRTVVIKLHEERVYFNDSIFFELNQTNLPLQHIKLTRRPIYWELVMHHYDKDEMQLEVSIADYDSKKIDKWEGQSAKHTVRRLIFMHIDWARFENCLSYYDGEAKKALPYNRKYDLNNPLPKPVTLIHRIPLRKLTIGSGYVQYSKKVQWSGKPQIFVIRHTDMIPQLEYVKPYFSKILDKKTIEVQVTVWKEEGRMHVGKVLSPDLAKINQDSLYVIKGIQIDNFKKKMRPKAKDKMLLTEDEWLEDVETDFGNVDVFEREILFHYLEKSDVRNVLQLQYLSEVMSQDARLMLTIEPQFGFVFTIIGDEMIHFVWELINTHATYVWSLDASMLNSNLIKRLEAEFDMIVLHGRSHYRHVFEAADGLFFHAVNHKSSQNPMVDHFGDWKVSLEKILL